MREEARTRKSEKDPISRSISRLQPDPRARSQPSPKTAMSQRKNQNRQKRVICGGILSRGDPQDAQNRTKVSRERSDREHAQPSRTCTGMPRIMSDRAERQNASKTHRGVPPTKRGRGQSPIYPAREDAKQKEKKPHAPDSELSKSSDYTPSFPSFPVWVVFLFLAQTRFWFFWF